MNSKKFAIDSEKIMPATSHYQKLKWLQKTRTAGLWVQCDECNRWRHLPEVLDRHQLSMKWYCSMNPDNTKANCSEPEDPVPFSEEEDLIHSEYSAGSLVVANVPGWPWWPGMVDDCPDTELFYWLDGFSDIPTYYNVTFFDSNDVTRAWVAPEHLRSYAEGQNQLKKSLKSQKYAKRISEAIKQADNAETLPLGERLAKYSFIAKYGGKILRPRKVTKNEIRKYNNIFKRKYNVDLPCEDSESGSTEDDEPLSNKTSKENVVNANNSKKMKCAIDDVETNIDENTKVVLNEINLCRTLSKNDTDLNNNNFDTLKDLITNDIPDEVLQRHQIPTPPSDDFDF